MEPEATDITLSDLEQAINYWRGLRPSRGEFPTRMVDGRERIAHVDDACDLRFGDVANHLFHVVRSDRSEIVIAVTGGNRAVEYGCDRR